MSTIVMFIPAVSTVTIFISVMSKLPFIPRHRLQSRGEVHGTGRATRLSWSHQHLFLPVLVTGQGRRLFLSLDVTAIILLFFSLSQNEQKTDLKKSQICPIWCQSRTLQRIDSTLQKLPGGILEPLVPSFPTCFDNHMEHFNLIQKVLI